MIIKVLEKKRPWVEAGLSAAEVEESRARSGANVLTRKKKKSFLRQLLANFGDPIIRVLLIALAVNVVVLFREVNWFETGGILLAVFLSTFVSTVSEWGSERAFEKLRESAGTGRCRVIRDGTVREIPAEELVVGDCLLLAGGEQVQADVTVCVGEVTVDQSALNGESIEVHKYPAGGAREWDLTNPAQVFRGSLICSGEAVTRVTRVGSETYYGSLAQELQTETRESPLKLRLSQLATQISRIGYVMAALVALAYLFNAFFLSRGFDSTLIMRAFSDRRYVFETLIHTVTLVITVIVVAVPEGLPMMITVVLSSNMRRMLRDQVLVRKMVGIETAGSLNVLFTDKTGTLTTGKMSVCGTVCGGGVFYRSARALSGAGEVRKRLCESAMWNTDSAWTEAGAVGGNATDRALLTYFHDASLPAPTILKKCPFNSTRKMAAVGTSDGIYVKGAPELLLRHVTTYLTPTGDRKPMTAADRADLDRSLQVNAARGERLLAVCLADRWIEDAPNTPLCLVGIVLLRDRVRREARPSVETLTRAGVQIVMVTGDGQQTATAIAREAGILTEVTPQAVLSGGELADMDDDTLRERLGDLRVIYRALPSDKTRLVRVAQSLNLVTGMTGDGINDAPSLKLADVGFAMGSGTDIAREAGDIVILDDNIASICKTVLYGRTIFKSIRKFITFQITMNLCAVGVSLIGQFIGIESPVTIIQMLWVNIIMDTLGGLAFAGEAPMAQYMKEKPKKREERILSPAMLHQIALTGAYTLALCIWFLCSPLCAYYFGRSVDETYFLTLFFALFIFCGIANCFCARSERMSLFSGIGRNKGFLLIMLFICCVQILMIYFGGTLFRTTPVAARDLAAVIAMSLTVIPFDFLRRLFYRLSGH
jgi:calcium-translocating P-type ATPase